LQSKRKDGVSCKACIIDYSISVVCLGGGAVEGNGQGGEEGKEKKLRKEDKRRSKIKIKMGKIKRSGAKQC
jgi:hypothetical protein